MNERIRELAKQAEQYVNNAMDERANNKDFTFGDIDEMYNKKFAELIVRECIDKIETHRIPVGNSAAGEMACEWTYAALKEIRDDIKEHFGVKE